MFLFIFIICRETSEISWYYNVDLRDYYYKYCKWQLSVCVQTKRRQKKKVEMNSYE